MNPYITFFRKKIEPPAAGRRATDDGRRTTYDGGGGPEGERGRAGGLRPSLRRPSLRRPSPVVRGSSLRRPLSVARRLTPVAGLRPMCDTKWRRQAVLRPWLARGVAQSG